MAATRNREHLQMSGDDAGREWRDLLLRLLDGVKDDIASMRDSHNDLRDKFEAMEKVGRSAFVRVEGAEDRLTRVETEAKASTVTLAEIKTMGRSAGYLGGLVAGVLGALLTAFVMTLLHL